MLSLLVFMLCFFIGSMAMFFYSLKKSESQFRSLSEENARLRVLLRAMESRLDNIEKYLAARAGSSGSPEDGVQNDTAEGQGSDPDPLLHLSFEDPEKAGCRGSGLDLLLDGGGADEKRGGQD